MFYALIELLLVMGLVVTAPWARAVISQHPVEINPHAAPRYPVLLALLLGLGSAVCAMQLAAGFPAAVGIPYKFILEIKLASVVLFAAVNGAVAVVAFKHFGGTWVRGFILVNAFIYLNIFGVLTGLALYQCDRAHIIGPNWSKLAFYFFRTISASIRRGLALVVVLTEIFLGGFCGVLAGHIPVRVLVQTTTPSPVPALLSPPITGLAAGIVLAMIAGIQEWIKSKYSGYFAQLLEVIGGIVLAGFTIIAAVSNVAYANYAYKAQDWQWRAFLTGAMGGIFWGIQNFFTGTKPSRTSTAVYFYAKFLGSLLHAILYFTGFGIIAFIATLVYVRRHAEGAGEYGSVVNIEQQELE